VFAATLLGACLCVARFFPLDSVQAASARVSEESETEEEFSFDGTIYEEYSVSLKTAASSRAQKKDDALSLYRATLSRAAVEWFYAHITENTEISSAILEYADANDIPPSLAFALAYTESRYKPSAVNRNVNGTIDRGLFQLNSASFPRLTEAEFFDPKTSARYGLAHFKYCLTVAENEVAALAMYNAGITRIKNDSTPRKTLNYISHILRYRQTLDDLFKEEIALFFNESANPILAMNTQAAERNTAHD
jgi:soluble lytic murein transglycosylase-like protein